MLSIRASRAAITVAVKPAPAAVLWGAAQRLALRSPAAIRRAGIDAPDHELGEALFGKILDGRSGVIFAVETHEDTWRRLRALNGKVNLHVPALLPVVLMTLYPIGHALWTSLHEVMILFPGEPFVGLKNYQRVVGSNYFQDALRNSLVFTLMAFRTARRWVFYETEVK